MASSMWSLSLHCSGWADMNEPIDRVGVKKGNYLDITICSISGFLLSVELFQDHTGI